MIAPPVNKEVNMRKFFVLLLGISFLLGGILWINLSLLGKPHELGMIRYANPWAVGMWITGFLILYVLAALSIINN